MQALIAAARATPSIRVLTGHEAEDLVIENGRAVGVRLARGETRGQGTYELIPASAVVLATGGVGGLYAVTTNPAYARGEAIAFAARAGAVIADPEFVQFHPTAMDIGSDPAPLATEALRGEGALLVNKAGERFMLRHHPDAELAPRDIVARGVFEEVIAGRGAFLDCRAAVGARFATAYPTVYAHCKAAGIDPVRELIPVAPAAHYHMGGIATDMHGRTSVEGLWAAGEVASTGLHGANRLASNSLLEAIVLGGRVAEDVRALVPATDAKPIAKLKLVKGGKVVDMRLRADSIRRIRRILSEEVGVVREAKGLKHALVALREISAEAAGDAVVSNMALTARLIAAAALARKESRGGHFRSDFPEAQARMQKRTFVTLSDLDAIEAHTGTKPRTKRAALELSL
jgi:L-aspartate oxidase